MNQILNFMGEFGRAYLSSGGPTSRLEEILSQIGKKFGYPSEVFATPTGLFVSCSSSDDGSIQTTLCRIKESGVNLDRLCWLEGLYEDLNSDRASLDQALSALRKQSSLRVPYSLSQTVIAAGLSGFALSFSSYRNFLAAFACGLISIVTWWLSGSGLKSKISSSIFRDFIGCVATLGLASLCQIFWPAPFDAYTIGGLIILVPGLSLTSAIAELADQNLVSGTAKLMQAMLTILAIGMAYLLFYDLSHSMNVAPSLISTAKRKDFLVSAVSLVISVTCFGVILRVPHRALAFSTLTGFVGWFVMRMFNNVDYIVAASYIASLSVGVVSLLLGKVYKFPSQVFSAPGIIAMLPGMLALTSFSSLAMGNGSHGIELAFRVALSAGSIVFGLFSARIPFAFRPFKL